MTRGRPLDPKQVEDEVYTFIGDYCRLHGYGPSYREIQAGVDIAAGTAHRAVENLRLRKLVGLLPNRARSLHVLAPPEVRGRLVGSGIRKPPSGAPPLESILRIFSRRDAYFAQRKRP